MHNKQALSPIDELPIPVNTKGLEAVTSSELEWGLGAPFVQTISKRNSAR